MQEPEVASILLAMRDLWNDTFGHALVQPDRQKPFLADLLEQLNDDGTESAVVELVRQFYATVLNPARMQVFIVGPHRETLDSEDLHLSQQLTRLIARAYSSRPLPPPFTASLSRSGLRSCMGGESGVARMRGCPVMSMAATDRCSFVNNLLISVVTIFCSAYLTSFSDGNGTPPRSRCYPCCNTIKLILSKKVHSVTM